MIKQIILLTLIILGCETNSSIPITNSYRTNQVNEINLDVAELGFGNSQNSSVEITLNNPIPTPGFQFEVVTTNNFIITGASGGLAEELGFTVSTSESGVVLGFSFQGTLIPAGNHVITNVTYEGENQAEFC